MFFSVFITISYIEPNHGFASASSVSDFAYNKQITINHTQVEADQPWFCLWLNISCDSDLASHCVNDSGYDIAFFNKTNETQFPHEIEYWNDDGTYVNASIWVNVTDVSSTDDTILYMYYGLDNTNQQNVAGTWHSNFGAVWHLKDNTDSSSNGYNLTEHNIDDGNYGNTYVTINHNGENNEYFDISDKPELSGNQDLSFIIWYNLHSFGSGATTLSAIISKIDGSDDTDYRVQINDRPDYKFEFLCEKNANTFQEYNNETVVENTWNFGSVVWDDGNTNNFEVVTNHEWGTTNVKYETSVSNDGTDDVVIGQYTDAGWFNGSISEIWVYDGVLANETIMTYANMFLNATNGSFFTFGTEIGKESESTYQIKGLSDNRVTWSGTSDDVVWCNNSGDANEYPEINMSINATDNVTEIRIWVGDLNDTGAFINASNISLYISSDNSSYGLMGTFSDGGSNISINSSTWNAGTMGTNPFTGEGITNKNQSIYFLLKLSIPSGLSTDTFYSISTTAWKIYIGHYT